MFEVIYEPAVLKFETDLILINDKWVYSGSEINICPITELKADIMVISQEKIKVINADENTLKLFTDFLDNHGHLILCQPVLEALCGIFNYSFSLLEFGENLIVASNTFHTAVLTVIKTAVNCKVYFTNKQMHFYSTLKP